jgi:hypothetical protein
MSQKSVRPILLGFSLALFVLPAAAAHEWICKLTESNGPGKTAARAARIEISNHDSLTWSLAPPDRFNGPDWEAAQLTILKDDDEVIVAARAVQRLSDPGAEGIARKSEAGISLIVLEKSTGNLRAGFFGTESNELLSTGQCKMK